MSEETSDVGEAFAFFTEVGILHQLSTNMLAKTLPEGVHPSHFSIINHLVRTSDAVSPAQITSAMQVTKTTMSHSIKVLVERNYISTEPDPNDGRGKLVVLTQSGRDFHKEAIEKVTEAVVSIIGPEQLVQMRRVCGDLERLRMHLDNHRL
ncbi:MarR family winged helix-turn-helix transcriptional regulator [Litoreibacter roseus]|uniref:MarR family transcriptional regulator n=1 Tax=Litoreibacter roseus TaxID=2601869 RepID=A0A6N6JLP6_9RHOB|nr:MarR family transcriptional regulator [Litoreibacter roseus]GFE67044.1 MarR family transcriptional regulator [Litoreibacter roseus]